MATKDLAERLRATKAGEEAVKATESDEIYLKSDAVDRCTRAALAVMIPGPHVADGVCSSGDERPIPGTCYLSAWQMKYVVCSVLAALDRLSEVESGSEGVTDEGVTFLDSCKVMNWFEAEGRPTQTLRELLQEVFGGRLAADRILRATEKYLPNKEGHIALRLIQRLASAAKAEARVRELENFLRQIRDGAQSDDVSQSISELQDYIFSSCESALSERAEERRKEDPDWSTCARCKRPSHRTKGGLCHSCRTAEAAEEGGK